MRKIWGAIIIRNNRVLLIKRSYNKTEHPNLWAFPGWWNEENETMEETVVREVKEEVGLDFRDVNLYHENKTEKHHFFRFMWIWVWKIIIEESESDGYWWFSYSECMSLPMTIHIKELLDRLYNEKYIQ